MASHTQSIPEPPEQTRIYSHKHTQKPNTAMYPDQQDVLDSTPNNYPTRTNSYRRVSDIPSTGSADAMRSFADRAKTLPNSHKLQLQDQPVTPNGATSTAGNSTHDIPRLESQAHSPSTQRYQSSTSINYPSRMQTSTDNSPDSRQGSQNMTARQKQAGREWAAKRSPLKKLETTLNDISKEEKRARVLEAEMLLKEAQREQQNRQVSRDTGHPQIRTVDQSHTENKTVASKLDPITQPKVTYTQQARPREDAPHVSEPESSLGLPLSLRRKTHDNKHSFPHTGSGEHHQRKDLPMVATPQHNISARSSSHTGRLRANQNLVAPKLDGQPVKERELFENRNALQISPPVSFADDATMASPEEPSPAEYNREKAQIYIPEPHPEVLLEPDYTRGSPAGSQKYSDQGENGHGKQVSFAVPPPTPPPVFEWKTAGIARLRQSDFHLEDPSQIWWERGNRSHQLPKINMKANMPFNPPLHLKCGPLLRFTGIKREIVEQSDSRYDREIWRGNIMIVTKDSASSYDMPPTLRIFCQSMELLPPPPAEVSSGDGEQLAPEYIDPIAGLSKIGRTGNLLFVKPVDHIEEEKDLSSNESEDGLFEGSPSPVDYGANHRVSQPPNRRIHAKDGETFGKYKITKGTRLYADSARDVTFWRFNIEIELSDKQERVAYRINNGSTVGFWIPARGQSMNIMFHTGNGFGSSVDSNRFNGPDPLWRDVLNTHQTRPFHVMIGGGSQIYNDSISTKTTHFQRWLGMKVKYEKYEYPLNLDIKAEMEDFYLGHYLMRFSQGLFGMACSQIPMVNMWDDHEIIAGYGSFSEEFMSTPVFTGLGNIAFKYYLLFQHQSVVEETELEEPSWIIGESEGPYIMHQSRHVFLNMGKRLAFLALDCRTERTRDEVISDKTYDIIWDRCHIEIEKGDVKHMLVLSPGPVAYPRIEMIETVLHSRVMDPVKALGRKGVFRNMETKIKNSPEALDDHWISRQHKLERKWLVEDLQELAARKSVRVTILGGATNLGAVGQFCSDPKLQIPKDQDYRYMTNVISSSIVDAPISELMSDTINRRNKTHILDLKTVENMRPIFTHDVEGKPRNNKRLLPRRNWCSIREYVPGSTPPGTPSEPPTPSPPTTPEKRSGGLRRTLSLSRATGTSKNKLVRRFSQRGPPPSSYPASGKESRRMSFDTSEMPRPRDDYFSHNRSGEPRTNTNPRDPPAPSSPLGPGHLMRQRTDLSAREIKQAAKTGSNLHHFVNLEGGLDITLNCELNSRDPAGITTPYRMLVPALSYNGEFELLDDLKKHHWWSFKRNKSPEMSLQVARGEHGGLHNTIDQGHSSIPEQDPEYAGHHSPSQEVGQSGYDRTKPPDEDQFNTAALQGMPRAQGYDGVEAYRPRKKWLGIL
ncbi:hypothetical protein FQN57_002220 [Myotisia sp. PD_48]|nr:hypothetical protein FQN57_002220 [Myotisia sp. PD_48]